MVRGRLEMRRIVNPKLVKWLDSWAFEVLLLNAFVVMNIENDGLWRNLNTRGPLSHSSTTPTEIWGAYLVVALSLLSTKQYPNNRIPFHKALSGETNFESFIEERHETTFFESQTTLLT